MTTTDTDTDTDNLVDAAMRAEQDAAGKSLAEIQPEQQRFTGDQIAILRQLGVEEATDGDLNLFFHVCRTTGLDPFRKQIYMIGRNTKVVEWIDNASGEGRRKVERYVTKYTIQTGIDGYRRNGREAAKALGDELRFVGPLFTGADDFHVTEDGEVIQHWRKVWPAGTVPHAARFVVSRNGEEFEGIAHYDEFVQTNAVWEGSGQSRRMVGQEPNSMWAKMPRNQLAKCAEALAWRRAYPDDFSGLILEDAAQPTVIDSEGNVEREGRAARVRGEAAAGAPITVDEILGETTEPAEKPKRQRPSGTLTRAQAEAKRAARDAEPAPVDAEVVAEAAPDPEPVAAPSDSGSEPEPSQVDEPPAEAAPDDDVRSRLIRKLFVWLGKADVTEREDRLVIYRKALQRPEISSTNDLSDEDLDYVISGLEAHDKKGDLTVWAEAVLIAAVEAETAAAQQQSTTTEGK